MEQWKNSDIKIIVRYSHICSKIICQALNLTFKFFVLLTVNDSSFLLCYAG